MRFQRAALSVLFAFTLVMVAACGGNAGDQAGSAGGDTSVRIGWIGDPHYSDMSMLNQSVQGARVQLEKFQLSQDELNAISSNDLDMASLGYAHFLKLLDAGVPVTAVAGVCTGGTRILLRKGVNATTWAELAKLKIGIARGSTQDLQLQAAFAKNGVNPKSVNYVTFTSAPDMMIGLEQSAVDALSIWEPSASQAVIKGIGHDFPENVYDNSWKSNSLLVVRTDFLKAHPDAVKSVVRGLADNAQKLTSDHQLWNTTAAKFVPLPADVISKATENMGESVHLYTSDFEPIARIMAENGYLKSAPSPQVISNHIDLGPLSKATGKARSDLSS